MTSGEIVRAVMNLRGYTLEKLAKDLGYATTSGLSNRIYNKSGMRVDTLESILKEMNCEIVIRSTLKDKKEWIVESHPED